MASFGPDSDDDAKKMFPEGWRSPKPNMRIVKQPVCGRSRSPSSSHPRLIVPPSQLE
jgi:hypothetical protein